MLKEEFITYGKIVRRDKFNNLVDKLNYINKPIGGLWASPVNSRWSWKSWCESNDFRVDSFRCYTKWKLRDPRRILIIDSAEDLIRATDRFGILFYFSYILDFQKIKDAGYDGIFLTARGNSECHFSICYKGETIDLNSWDCESIVVWNWKQIKIIEAGRKYGNNRAKHRRN